MKLFIDTWGWLALHDRREARHEEVVRFYNDFRSRGGSIYTTDYVLDETFTLLFRRLPFSQAQEAADILMEIVQQGYLYLEWITPDRFEQTRSLRSRFRDKPLISFTDLSSMVVMENLRVSHILTADNHFTYVGLSFQMVP